MTDHLITLRDHLRYSVTRFEAAGLTYGHGSDNAWDEAAYLLCHALHLPLERLDAFLDARLLPEERAVLLDRIERRASERLPAPYLTGEAWLSGHRFRVDRNVIVPRSFIAELLDEGLNPWIADPMAVGKVLDLCTGSGCLAILAALAFPEASIDAIDISPGALAVAHANRGDYKLESRLRLIESDLFTSLGAERYDLIISNPPYVDADAMAALPDEYRHEPSLALAGGSDGLDLVHRIFAGARARLNPGGLLVVEIGHNRAVLEAAYPDTGFVWLETEAGDEYVFLLHRDEIPLR
ncbi:MAG TPA: 50S ribosomal protein L3 N(5)-glutamine methyltransferase [Rhodocyclaceae bacterium]